jgi:NhaP-type Na+/H+ or K+/H+ antiporter
MIELAAIAAVFLAFSLVSRRLQNTVLTASIFFVGAGLVLGSRLIRAVDLSQVAPFFLVVGVVALSLSFFNQASRINPATLPGAAALPARLLLIGLPLTAVAGALVGAWLFPGLTLIEAALLGTILAPADTGLIPAVMGSERVPVRIRQALNVESSLNDSITTPFATLFMALAQTELGLDAARIHWLSPLTQVGLALLIGLAVGGGGGWLLREADRRGWINPGFQGLVFPSLTMIALPVAYLVGGNYFIACFVAGMTTAWVFRDYGERYSHFSETAEHMLSLVVLLILGTEFVKRLPALDWRIVLYAVLSLTVVRMAPVAVALLGKRLHWESVLFLGWFGPRGLASIVLGTLVLDRVPGIPHSETITLTVMSTVVLSIVLHGASAVPLVVRYGQRAARFEADAPENKPVAEMPIRLGWSLHPRHTEERLSAWETRTRRRE